MHREVKGFTLIELIVVIAIVTILSSIAIPLYRNYQLKAKTTEARVNLAAIRTAEESYSAENGNYIACSARPNVVPGPQPQDWGNVPGNGFDIIGFAPAGKVYYRYMVFPGYSTTDGWPYTYYSASPEAIVPARKGIIDITMLAQGDLDGDKNISAYGCIDENSGTFGEHAIKGPYGDDF